MTLDDVAALNLVDYYARYGYALLIAAAFARGFIVTCWWALPLSPMVAGAVILAADGRLDVGVVALLTVLSYKAAHIANYVLGLRLVSLLVRFPLVGPGVLASASHIARLPPHARFARFAAVHLVPIGASVGSTAAGVARVHLGEFLITTTILTTLWNTVWVAINYCLGVQMLAALTPQLGVLAALVLVILILASSEYILPRLGRLVGK